MYNNDSKTISDCCQNEIKIEIDESGRTKSCEVDRIRVKRNELVIFERGVKDNDDNDNIDKVDKINCCNKAGVDQDKNQIRTANDKKSGEDNHCDDVGLVKLSNIKRWIKADSDRMLIKKVFALYDSRGRYQCIMDHDVEVVLEENLNISV
ncbi:2705_t:CDS:2, partial [Racocetra persica]